MGLAIEDAVKQRILPPTLGGLSAIRAVAATITVERRDDDGYEVAAAGFTPDQTLIATLRDSHPVIDVVDPGSLVTAMTHLFRPPTSRQPRSQELSGTRQWLREVEGLLGLHAGELARASCVVWARREDRGDETTSVLVAHLSDGLCVLATSRQSEPVSLLVIPSEDAPARARELLRMERA